MATRRIVFLPYFIFYLCVVVKERAEPCHQSCLDPDSFASVKSCQTSGGRDWIRTSDPALIKRML